MKLKILIPPVVIVAVISLIIWGIVPAWADLSVNRDSLKNDQGKLADAQDKKKNVDSLFQELNSSVDQQNTLLKYLPYAKQEEDLFNTISGLASQEGLLVSTLSLQKDTVAASENAGIDLNASTSGPGGEVAVPKPSASSFNVKVGIAGDYQKVKNLLNKLNSLSRFNKLLSLEISTVDAASASDGGLKVVSPDMLNATMELSFSYLKKSPSVANFNEKVFSSDKFDMSSIAAITNRANVGLMQIKDNSAGRENPFIQ